MRIYHIYIFISLHLSFVFVCFFPINCHVGCIKNFLCMYLISCILAEVSYWAAEE